MLIFNLVLCGVYDLSELLIITFLLLGDLIYFPIYWKTNKVIHKMLLKKGNFFLANYYSVVLCWKCLPF